MTPGAGRFEGRHALITGAAHGIGAATCRRLVAEGAHVIVADIDLPGAELLAAALGSSASAHVLDVGDPDAWAILAADLTDSLTAGLDVVVNNAFTLDVAPASELALESWERQIAVDLSSVFHSVKMFLPMLTERGGAMVNVSSVHAVAGYPGHPAYAAAKGGVAALTRQLSADYGDRVRFNAVLPGAIDTRVWEGADEADRLHHAGLAAMRRLGKPEEVAAAIAFLASDDASYVCGATLTVDGGLTSSRF